MKHTEMAMVFGATMLGWVVSAFAQPVKVGLVVKVGDIPSGSGGSAVSTLNAPFTDGNGKACFTGNLTPSNNFVWHGEGIIWKNSDGAPGHTLTGAEGTMGASNLADFIYSPSIDGDDGVWGGDGYIAKLGDPAPGHRGQFFTFCSRPIMLPDGTAYFVSGMTPTQGSATTVRRVMYRRTPTALGGTLAPVYTGGENLGGFTIANAGIEFGYDVSDNGLHYIQQFTMTGVPAAMDSFIYVNGAPVAREGTSTGQGANWATFTGMSINNSGNYVFGSNDNGAAASNVSVVYNGVPTVREGQTIDGFNLASGSSLGWVSINNLNKVVHLWNRTGFDALFAGNGADLAATSKLLLKIGDEIDVNNDNVADSTVIDFEASAAISPGLSFSDHNLIYAEVTLRDIGSATNYEAIIRIPIPVPCIADVAPPGGNAVVNVDDLLAVINGWGACSLPCPPSCVADIAPSGGNCVVNVDDLLAIINGWGACQ